VIAVVGRGDVADDGPGNCGASRGKMDLEFSNLSKFVKY